MPSIPITIDLGSAMTGLTTLAAKVYSGASLVASVSLTESPVASGRYTGTFSAPATVANYDGTVQDSSGNAYGQGFSFQTTASGLPLTPGPDYCVQSDIENIFGVSNVAQWSNLDNTTTTANPTRITAAITYATSRVNNYMRGGIYAVPLVINSDAQSVIDVAATIAGVWLYSSRGQLDTMTNAMTGGTYLANRYGGMLKQAMSKLMMWRMGLEQLDAVPSGAEATPGALDVPVAWVPVRSLPGCV